MSIICIQSDELKEVFSVEQLSKLYVEFTKDDSRREMIGSNIEYQIFGHLVAADVCVPGYEIEIEPNFLKFIKNKRLSEKIDKLL